MPARNKKPVPKPQQPRPELNIQPRRWRVIITFALCLIVFAVISQAAGATFLGSNTIGSVILFAFLYLVGLVYLLGVGWSAVRLLTDSQPPFQANNDGLTLRHLPFLGNISLSWSEIKSVHTARSLFLTHLCIVPTDAHQFSRRRNLLLFALNASARLSMNTRTPLSVSQSALSTPVKELVKQLVDDYGIKETE
jgi:hypothetical protein